MVKFLLSKGAELEDMLLFETDHLPIIKYLLKKGAKATATDSHGDSLLHKHCKSGNLKNAKFLVRHYKAEVSAKNEKGQTPLHLACKNGNNLKMVKFFIERNHSDLAFLSEENLKMVKFLIEEQKADPTFTCDEGKTALHYAAEGIDLGIFKYLIEDQKLDIEAIDNEGRTPLHLAAQNEFLIDLVWPTLKYMIEKQQKIIEALDNSKRAALQYCLESYKRKKEFIEKFKPIAAILVAKAKILETKESKNTDHIFDWIKKAYNSKFRTEDDEAVSCLVSGLGSFQKQVDSKDGTYRQFNPLLYVACYCNRLDIAGYMFRQDIGYIDKNINAAGENLKRNLLLRSYMRFSCKEGFLDLTRFLLQELSNNQESFGQLRFQGEFLKTACRYKQINVFKYLLEDEKAKDEAAEFLKYFPLHYACAKGSLEMVQYLIETNKADVESKDKEDQTPLQCALCCGSIKIVKYLIEGKNAFFDTSIAHRKKLFQVLCNSESLELFKYINTTFKLDVNAQDENGFTALHSACKQYRNLKVAKFLITDMKANLQSLDEEGRTPLHVACQSKFPKVQISKLLVNQGANVLAKDNTGKTPLQSVRSPYHLSKFLITFLRAATKR
jgi:ankyrin repeat protein